MNGAKFQDEIVFPGRKPYPHEGEIDAVKGKLLPMRQEEIGCRSESQDQTHAELEQDPPHFRPPSRSPACELGPENVRAEKPARVVYKLQVATV